MATFRPFKSLRPRADIAQKIAALPYDVYTTAEAKEAVKDNPYSFLHVDKAEIDFDNDVSIYSDEVYNKAAENYKKMISNGWLVKDDEEAFYLYRLEFNGRIQTGIAGLASIDDYIDGIIKKHELTRKDKEDDRIRHIQSLNAQTGLIFLTYKAKDSIKEITEFFAQNNEPIYKMEFDDNTKSTVWRISEKDIIDKISKEVSNVSNLFIADGHHRNAAAVNVGLKKRRDSDKKDAPYNYYLSVIFPDRELYIMDYNRVVKDLNGLSEDAFIDEISKNFHVYDREDPEPKKRHEFGLYIAGKWRVLVAKNHIINEDDVLLRLDVSILQDYILGPLLNITDVRTDKRIDFIGGIRGLSEIKRRVDSDMKAGFAMFPTSMYELIDVATNNRIMPPKSTWFEPKLRSGIFIHEI